MSVEAAMTVRHSTHCSGAMGRQRGAGLIEVMISVLILAIGLLGIAAMQAAALRNSQSALERSQGIINTYAIIDAMRANVMEVRAGAYELAETCAVPVSATTSVAQSDIAFWLDNLQRNLGGQACGEIDCEDNQCVVTVTWDDTRGTGGVGDLSFATEVIL